MKQLILINKFKMIISVDSYLSQHRNDVVMAHQMRISNKLSNNRRCLDKSRTHNHNPVLKVELLNITKHCYFLTSTITLSETYDRVCVHRNQQPNCSCSDCVRLLCHQKVNHFRMFLMSMFHLYTKRIDRNCLDEHKLVHRMVLDNVEQLHHGLENQE